MSRYFYPILFLVFGAASGLWPSWMDSNLDIPCCGINCCPNCPDPNMCDTVGCVLKPSFSATFDPPTCSITLYNVWNDYTCDGDVYLDINGNNDWTSITPEEPFELTEISSCDPIRISTSNQGDNPIAYSGLLTCDCGPCTPADPEAKAIISNVLADPMNHFLNNTCCCSDYAFIFPDGKKVQAIVATLHLRVDHMNDQHYSIDNINEVGKTISLKQ